jgi:hypothetical protein
MTPDRVRNIAVAPLIRATRWHYTPKHGGWLDLADSELSVLSA